MISVLIPVFNSEKYLAACLDSVINQSFKDIEIICVDDGSTDSSPAILNRYLNREPRMTVFRQENSGRSAARNKALDLAKGSYVCFIDSDDMFPPDALNNLYVHTKSKAKDDFYDAVVGSIEVEYDVHDEMQASDSSYYTIRLSGPKKPTDDLLWDFHASSCACLFKLNTIRNLDLKFPTGINYEDAYWHWCFFSSCKNIYFTTKVVYKYFRREGSIMSQTFEAVEGKSLDHLKIARKIIEFWESKNCIAQHENTIPRLIEQFFWLSFRYCPRHERATIIAEAISLLRKYKGTNGKMSEVLKKIKKGDVGFLFVDTKTLDEVSYLSIFFRMVNVINRYIPRGSKTRAFLLKFSKLIYRTLS